MKLILPTIFLLPFVLAQAQNSTNATNSDCPSGFTPFQDPPSTGNIKCKKVEAGGRVDIVCPGTNRDYVDPNTGANLCCPVDQQLVTYDQQTREGACCGVGQTYLGDAPNGKCCATGQILQNGKCVTPPPPPPPPTGGCASCPQQPQGACGLKVACGDATNNGLQYGHCYQLTFPGSGSQLGRGLSGALDQYAADGYIQNIVYKICKATTAAGCGTGPVAATDVFYIEDDTGSGSDTAGTLSWINNANGGTHMSLTTVPAQAGQFSGKTSCSGCKCTIQLSRVGYACPSTQPGITFWPNPKVGLDLRFTEIPCDGDFADWHP